MLSESAARAGNRIESIRQAMLESLGDSGRSAFPAIERRVRFASDVQGLWYLRGDMMEALSSLQGEYMARRKMDEISVLFQGALPRSMASRQSRLSA
ncbi:MAG: hypothetical protein IPF55_05265 [Rhodoferax sp.]|nr:hypothetical protein [Rhodoferax sp.]